jgi:Glutaredoxin-like domain (DUF836)
MIELIELIMYSKSDCCLCQALLEKLHQVSGLNYEVEVRDINANPNWLASYEYEVPVLCWLDRSQNPPAEIALPRLAPRSPVSKLESLLQNLP